MIFTNEIDMIVTGRSYKTLKLWEIHDYIFTNVYESYVPELKSIYSNYGGVYDLLALTMIKFESMIISSFYL